MSVMGTYSGITMETIDQMIQAESGKVVRYTNEQKTMETEKAAWKDVESRLSNLTTKLNDLLKAEAYTSKKISSSNDSKVSVQANKDSFEGNYNITVDQIATQTQVTGTNMNLGEKKLTDELGYFGGFSLSSQKTTGEGEIKTIRIEVKPESSMKDIVSAINDQSKESGITAVIIDNHLVLQDKEFGERTITMTENENNVTNLTEKLGLAEPHVKKGQQAIIQVNGITIERNTNTISDAIEGITIEAKEPTSEAVRISVVEDTEKTVESVKAFIEQYNSTLSFIKTQLDVGDPSQENNKTGVLSGDSSLLRLQSQLRSLLTLPVDNGNKEIKSVKDLGITVDRYGAATLDSEKLKSALKSNGKEVQNMFRFTKITTTTGPDDVAIKKEEEVGISQKFIQLINSYTDSKSGIIATKNETYDKLIKDLNMRVDLFNEKLEGKRQRYIKTFTALDIAMMEAESQMNYLASQMGNSSNNK